jgi:hypothetical protein
VDSSPIDRKSATPMTQAALDARLYLLGKNRSAVMVMLSKARREGIDVENVAAIVADTRDSVGGPMARAMAERSRGVDADAEAARAEAKDEIPTLVAVVPLNLAVALFADSHPAVSDGLRQPLKPGGLHVVVVASGGATLIQVRAEPGPVPASA